MVCPSPFDVPIALRVSAPHRTATPQSLPTRNLASANHMRKLLLAALCGALSCAHPRLHETEPTDASRLMQIPTPAIYQQWFTHVEECSGLTADLSTVRFFVAPRPLLALPDRPGLFLGLYYREDKRIILGLFTATDSAVVSHEELHFLLAENGKIGDTMHNPAYFLDKCAAVVGPTYGP